MFEQYDGKKNGVPNQPPTPPIRGEQETPTPIPGTAPYHTATGSETYEGSLENRAKDATYRDFFATETEAIPTPIPTPSVTPTVEVPNTSQPEPPYVTAPVPPVWTRTTTSDEPVSTSPPVTPSTPTRNTGAGAGFYSPSTGEPIVTPTPPIAPTANYGGMQSSYHADTPPVVTGEPATTGWNGFSHPGAGGAVPPMPSQSPPKKRAGSRILRYVSAMIAVFVLAASGGYFGSTMQQHRTDASETPSSVNAPQEGASASTGGGDAQAPVVQTGNIPDIVDKTAGSVVEVKTEAVQSSGFLQQYTASGAGSGVIVSKDGYIVTNHHVIAGADKITVTLKNGTSYDATLVGSDESTDLAVLKIDATDLVPVTFGDSDALRVGEMAIAIGNPLGELGGTVTNGLISALDREITIENQTMTLLQTNAAVNPGNSGGGLFNDKGELIGVVNAKTSASGIEGLGFAIPSNVAKPVIDDLIQNGYVTGRIRLGVSFVDITSEQIAMQYRVDEFGAYVYQVNPGSDAERAGLQPGDLVHMIGDKKIYQSSEIKTAMNDYSVGDQMKMTVKRDGKEIPITINFTENKPDNQPQTEPQLAQ